MIKPNEEKEFWEHLEELRWRIIRSIIYVVLGACFAWYKYDWVYDFLTKPVLPILKHPGSDMSVFNFQEAFILQIEVSLIAGIIFVLPLIFWEIWAFVSPALFKHEKRYVLTIGPFSFVLFVAGIVLAYYVIPIGLKFLAQFATQRGLQFHVRISEYVSFIIKMFLAFGALFEMPLLIMALALIGIVSSDILKKGRRYAIVIIFVIAAVVTPTVDWITMTILAVPLCFLYELSIWLAWFVERAKAKRELEEPAP